MARNFRVGVDIGGTFTDITSFGKCVAGGLGAGALVGRYAY